MPGQVADQLLYMGGVFLKRGIRPIYAPRSQPKKTSIVIGRQLIRRRDTMHVEKNSHGLIVGRLVGERRSGIDRRRLTYEWCIPERRTLTDRRQETKELGENDSSWRHRQRYA